ncbi:hypothetical protein ACFL2Q_00830 [Thermodesulfobacteriota bacterium]
MPSAGYRIIVVILSLSISAAVNAGAYESPSINDLFANSPGDSLYSPSSRELAAAEELFTSMFKTPVDQRTKESWNELGFELIPARQQGTDYWILKEQDDKKAGRGFYLFPKRPVAGNGLFIPHRFKDMLTGKIGRSLATEGSFAVVAWNTVPKWKHNITKKPNWNMARLQDSYFTALTRAFAKVHPKAYHIQIHGYARDKRKTAAGKETNVIVSGGTQDPGEELTALKACLGKRGFGQVALYPLDVRELGATINISGKALRAMDNRGFVHIEFDLGTRKQLLKDKELREALLNCLQQALK